MAEDKAYIKTKYPLPVYNFRVTIQSLTEGPFEVSFAEVSGLSVEYEPVTYKHGFSFLMGSKIIPGMRQPLRITLKRGILKSHRLLHEWIDDTYSNPFYLAAKKDILIDLCDEAGKPVIRWTVKKALPVKMDMPSFDANSNDVAIETMELIAAGLKVDYDPA